ncbi:unnamed protein product [Caenorhabditis auriculariae]|uniref:Uncharacterized protein n=1 Tax=Caenorhabditis auriculariae TaxID=2777116 RepID=A0A8S1HI93_9PELO|nr:unnamed protein product [Caenorhabditis auriculariae]
MLKRSRVELRLVFRVVAGGGGQSDDGEDGGEQLHTRFSKTDDAEDLRRGCFLTRTSQMEHLRQGLKDRSCSRREKTLIRAQGPADHVCFDFGIDSSPADIQHQLDSKKRARKRTPPDRSLVTSTPGAVLQESLQIEGRVASPLYQARTFVPQASAPHTAVGPVWIDILLLFSVSHVIELEDHMEMKISHKNEDKGRSSSGGGLWPAYRGPLIAAARATTMAKTATNSFMSSATVVFLRP